VETAGQMGPFRELLPQAPIGRRDNRARVHPEPGRLGSKITIELQPGDVVSFRTCGGGGYGRPEERDPQLVLRDVREGKVSVAQARDVYRVALDTDSWTVVVEETAQLRSARAGSEIVSKPQTAQAGGQP
jgi:N-methylhydantoinase B/oxoprolinase/acetone carboxylase alpha subunit